MFRGTILTSLGAIARILMLVSQAASWLPGRSGATTPPLPAQLRRPAGGHRAAPAQPARLVLPGGREVIFPLDAGEILIGRSDPQAGHAPTVDLGAFRGAACGVSGQHALLCWTGDRWTLTDLGSTGGTRVDGHPLVPHLPVVIHDRVLVGFGRLEADFRT